MSNDDHGPQPQTMHQLAMADAQLEMGHGRFAAEQRPRINGTEPIVTPPPGPAPVVQWPPEGEEGRLGYAIDEVPDMERNQ
jgi:hypothetical protein